MTPEELNSLKETMIQIIPENGSSIGNKRLRELWASKVTEQIGTTPTDDQYWTVRNALIGEGRIRRQRGQGGMALR